MRVSLHVGVVLNDDGVHVSLVTGLSLVVSKFGLLFLTPSFDDLGEVHR